MKRAPQFAGLLCVLAVLAPLELAQETHVSREGDAWSQVLTGSLAGVKNLRVKLDMGSVVVRGGQQGESITRSTCVLRRRRSRMRGGSSMHTK